MLAVSLRSLPKRKNRISCADLNLVTGPHEKGASCSSMSMSIVHCPSVVPLHVLPPPCAHSVFLKGCPDSCLPLADLVVRSFCAANSALRSSWIQKGRAPSARPSRHRLWNLHPGSMVEGRRSRVLERPLQNPSTTCRTSRPRLRRMRATWVMNLAVELGCQFEYNDTNTGADDHIRATYRGSIVSELVSCGYSA